MLFLSSSQTLLGLSKEKCHRGFPAVTELSSYGGPCYTPISVQ